MRRPVLFIDPQSPYAYLAASRAPALLGVVPELRVITLGVIFERRGYGSWARTPDRPAHVAEIQARAARYGLPAPAWPSTWPAPSLAPARAATVAARHGVAPTYLSAYWHRVFVGGAEPAVEATLAGAASDAGLDPKEVLAGADDDAVKVALRVATDAAWDRGVRTIPTLQDSRGVLHAGDEALDAVNVGPDIVVRSFGDMETTNGGAMRKVRAELGLTSFGVQTVDLPPSFDGVPPHDHATDGQEELYLALSGDGRLVLDNGVVIPLRRDAPVRVGPLERRRLAAGPEGLRVLVVAGVSGRPYSVKGVTELGAADPWRSRPTLPGATAPPPARTPGLSE